MKQALFLTLQVFLLFCAGCQTLQIRRMPASPPAPVDNPSTTSRANAREAKAEKVPGLPFYIKKAACLHTVVWLEPVYTLNLELVSTPAGASPKTNSSQLGTTVLSLSQLQAKDAQAFFHSLNADSSTIEEVVKAWVRVATAAGTPYTPSAIPGPSDRILVSNTSDPQVYVDYSQPYYVNVRRPAAGSAKVDSKLASDGTLTEVSAEVEEKTIEAITTGIKDLASAALGAAAKSEGPRPEQHVKLTITTAGYKHTLSRLEASSSFPCARWND